MGSENAPVHGCSVKPKCKRILLFSVSAFCKYARLILVLAVLLYVSASQAQTGANATEAVRDYLRQGQTAMRANLADAAVRDFRQALSLDPGNVEANLELGVIAFESGDCGNAEPSLKSALAGNSALTEARAFLAICERRIDQETAQVDMERSFSELKDVKLRIRVGIELVAYYLQRGELDRAASMIYPLTQLDPANIETLYLSRLVYSTRADDKLNELALLAPESARMQQALAERSVRDGNLKEAVDHYLKAVAMDPNLSGAHYGLAETILELSSNDAQAQGAASRELELSIKVDGKTAKAESLLGRIALLREDRKSAFEYYDRAIALDPRDEDAEMGLAKLLVHEGKPQEAMKHLHDIVGSNPLNAEAHYQLGMLYRDAGRSSDANRELLQYKRCEELKDQFPMILKVPHVEEREDQLKLSDAAEGGKQRTKYAGDAACLSCHKGQSISYLHTSHHLTSQPPSKDSILGSFSGESNTLISQHPALAPWNPGLSFKMEAKEGGYYETAVIGSGSNTQRESKQIDVVVGTGTHGQSYLFWQGNRLYELPISYWSASRQWINSPGYKDGTADFSRPITPRCLECHATYIEPLSDDPSASHFVKDSLVTGISCETCHGQGADHIARQKGAVNTSSAITGQGILNPAKFSRDRQVDLCALCHNGAQGENTSPAFSYLPGTPLDQYLAPNPADVGEHPDVHGNQVGLLKRSRCYLSSPQMSCSTCHDVHEPERPAATYSARCLSCHQWQSCGMSKRMGSKIVSRCIDCHMPEEETKHIVSETGQTMVRASMRNHWIKIYPDAHTP
jgi:tetratricopeptide (TPR) repeat protein